MASHANQSDCSPQRNAACRDCVEYKFNISVGSAGAASFAASSGVAKGGKDDPEITATLNGTGTYDITFPKGKDVWIYATVFSPASTVNGANVTAKSATAGTATIRTWLGSILTTPANVDSIMVLLKVER